MRIIQISDTHLSRRYDYFAPNSAAAATALAKLKPNLFIHTGDLAMDAALDPEELSLGKDWIDALPAKVLAVPGNHDVGDLLYNRPDQPVTDARLRAWRDTIGPDCWSLMQGGWQLIGLNAMLLGTGHVEEEAQFDWLASIVQRSHPTALFLHKPLCIERLDEGPFGYWTVPPEPRARLMAVLDGQPVRLFASGHLHVQHQHAVAAAKHVWAPATSFVVGGGQETIGGERQLGFVEHVFNADTVESRFIRPAGLKELLLDPVRDEIYPT